MSDAYPPDEPMPVGDPSAAPAPDDPKRWIPAIVLGAVLLVLVVLFAVSAFGDDGDDTAASATTSLTTTSSTTLLTTTSTTTSTTTTTTTAPPTTTTTQPTTTTTVVTTAVVVDPQLAEQCSAGDEFACYEAGRLGLAPPPGIGGLGTWKNASDDEVAEGCQVDLELAACFVAGQRNLPLTD